MDRGPAGEDAAVAGGPVKNGLRTVAQHLLDLLVTVGTYLLTVNGGTTMVLLLAAAFVYAAPGGRTEAVWEPLPPRVEPFQLEGFAARLVQMVGFGLFAAFLTFYNGIALWITARLMERLGAARTGVRVAGTVLSALLSGYVFFNLGQYIPFGSLAGVAGTLLGACFGAFQLPAGRRDVRGLA